VLWAGKRRGLGPRRPYRIQNNPERRRVSVRSLKGVRRGRRTIRARACSDWCCPGNSSYLASRGSSCSLVRLFVAPEGHQHTLAVDKSQFPLEGQRAADGIGFRGERCGGELFVGKRCTYRLCQPVNRPKCTRKWRFGANGQGCPLAETLHNVTTRGREEMIFRMMMS